MALTVTAVTPILLTTALQTVYTTPGSTTTLVKEIILCNLDTADRQVAIHFIPSGGSATSTNQVRIFGSTNGKIAAGDTEVWNLDTALAAADFVQAKADASSVVSIRMSVGQIT